MHDTRPGNRRFSGARTALPAHRRPTPADGPLRPADRAYLAVVGLFAAWVALWTWPLPDLALRTLPWPVPPLHARVVGSLYLAGTLALWGSLWSPQRSRLRLPVLWAVVWTGVLLLVSLLNLASFDARSSVVWFWWLAYGLFPAWGLWLWRSLPAPRRAGTADRPLALLAGTALALGLVLLLRPPGALHAWPWPLPPLLAQVYAGPCLACAAVLAHLARHPQQPGNRVMVAALAVLVALLLLASALHAPLLPAHRPATWAWWGALAGALGLLGWRCLRPAPHHNETP